MTEHKINIAQLPKIRGIYKIGEPLKKYTWLNVGGPADVMFLPADEADLQDFLRQNAEKIPVFILGGGSNLLIRDGGIDGVVIKLSNPNFTKIKIDGNMLWCGAGCTNFRLKSMVIENGLGGLEFLCSIPGTIGGAAYGNAGCFGSDMSEVLVKARVIDKQGKIFEIENKDFNFSYRHSSLPADWIVLCVGLHFEKTDAKKVSKQIAQNEEYRRTHQPQGIKTAGSTFKNPEGMAAWRLIKDAGADILVYGMVKMSAMHCNFLQNEGSSAADIERLCEKIKIAVKQKSGVELETEIKIIGRELKK